MPGPWTQTLKDVAATLAIVVGPVLVFAVLLIAVFFGLLLIFGPI